MRCATVSRLLHVLHAGLLGVPDKATMSALGSDSLYALLPGLYSTQFPKTGLVASQTQYAHVLSKVCYLCFLIY